MEQILLDLQMHVQALEEQVQRQKIEIRNLRVSLAVAKHPELAAQNPVVAEYISQKDEDEERFVSAINGQMELENAFRK